MVNAPNLHSKRDTPLCIMHYNKVISKIAIIGMIITCTSCYDEIDDSVEILFKVFVSH